LKGTTWAVLDGARDPRVARLNVGPPRAFCLYRGPLPAGLGDMAPHMLHLHRSHDYADTFFRVGWGNAWGILLATDAPQPVLYRHLRSLLLMKSEDKKQLVFRYYDPRILRQYLPTCTPQELDRFFGPVSTVALESNEPHTVELFRRAGSGFEHLRMEGAGEIAQVKSWPGGPPPASRLSPMVLRKPQLEVLADPALRTYQDRMVEYVRRDFPRDFDRLDVDGVRLLVLRARDRADRYGMKSSVEVTGFLSLMLILGEDFETRFGYEWIPPILASDTLPSREKISMILQRKFDSI
jgi:hypothetical protein